jgi:hypothetical protein
VPQPTSRTVLPSNKCAFFTIASRYAPVRTWSLSISSWMPVKCQVNPHITLQEIYHAPKWAYESA